MSLEKIQPRLIRLRDAPFYLGMDKNRFNLEVRPYLVEIPIGEQGIAFDRLDLDVWVDEYKKRSGRPKHRRKLWGEKEQLGLSSVATSGTSTSGSTESEFWKALDLIGSSRRKNT